MTDFDDVKSSVDIAEVMEACGFDVRGNRAKRPGGDSYSTAIYPEDQRFKDFVTGRGGDVFDFVQWQRDCGPLESLRWAAQFCGINPRGFRPPSVAAAELHERATVAAEELVAFRKQLIYFLRSVRNQGWTALHEAERLYRGSDRVGDLPACEWQALRQSVRLADRIDDYMGELKRLRPADLIALRRRVEGGEGDA